jgi:hypothetical protein
MGFRLSSFVPFWGLTLLSLLGVGGFSAHAADGQELYGFEIELRDKHLEFFLLKNQKQKAQDHTLKKIIEIHEEVVKEAHTFPEGMAKAPIIVNPTENPENVPDNVWAYRLRGPSDDYSYKGVWIAYTTDPFVMEVKGQKLSNRKLKEYESELEEQIFQRPKRHGFRPSSFSNSTHVTIDWVTAFGSAPQTSLEDGLDFIIDWANHAFSEGTLIYDPYNARGFRSSEGIAQRIARIFGSVREQLDLKNPQLAVKKLHSLHFSSAIPGSINVMKASIEGYPEIRVHIEWIENEYGETVIGPSSKIELRGFRGIENFHEFTLLTELLSGRIGFLEKQRKVHGPLVFNDTVATPHIADIETFKRYVEESGKSWKDYRVFAQRAYNPCNIALLPVKYFMMLFD